MINIYYVYILYKILYDAVFRFESHFHQRFRKLILPTYIPLLIFLFFMRLHQNNDTAWIEIQGLYLYVLLDYQNKYFSFVLLFVNIILVLFYF
jgi:hypothetical protein